MIRGQNAEDAFNVAPDWESYSATKLDISKPEDKEFVVDQWTWEKPVVVNGKEYKHADGKVMNQHDYLITLTNMLSGLQVDCFRRV